MSNIQTTQFVRKPFYVDAVQVTSENMEEVARWCNADIREDEKGRYIKVRVFKPANEKQTRAYVGYWVLYAGTGYKVYNNNAFEICFEPVTDQKTEQSEDGEAVSEKGKEVIRALVSELLDAVDGKRPA